MIIFDILFTLLIAIILLAAGLSVYLSLMDVCDRRVTQISRYVRNYNTYVLDILKRPELVVCFDDDDIFNNKECYTIKSLFKSKWHLIKDRDVRNSIYNFVNSQFYNDTIGR